MTGGSSLGRTIPSQLPRKGGKPRDTARDTLPLLTCQAAWQWGREASQLTSPQGAKSAKPPTQEGLDSVEHKKLTGIWILHEGGRWEGWREEMPIMKSGGLTSSSLLS